MSAVRWLPSKEEQGSARPLACRTCEEGSTKPPVGTLASDLCCAVVRAALCLCLVRERIRHACMEFYVSFVLRSGWFGWS